MRVSLGLVAAVLALASVAQAAPFDAKEVSADVKFAAHVDVDALMASHLVKSAREQIFKERPGVEAKAAAIRSLFRFDPMTDLHGNTIYGTQPLKKDTGVVIIHAKVDQKLLTDLAKANPGYESTTYGKFELHSWLKEGGLKRDHAAFFKPDVIVFGASLDELKAALDVLDGAKPNISKDYASLAASIPSGTILIAGAKDLAAADLHFESPLSKKIDSILLVAGEDQGQVAVHATLNVKDAATAQKMKTVADGALALAMLVKSDDADLMKLVNGVKVTVADKTVRLEAQSPADLLLEMMHKHLMKKARRLSSILSR
jgi:hypothetical protein